MLTLRFTKSPAPCLVWQNLAKFSVFSANFVEIAKPFWYDIFIEIYFSMLIL